MPKEVNEAPKTDDLDLLSELLTDMTKPLKEVRSKPSRKGPRNSAESPTAKERD